MYRAGLSLSQYTLALEVRFRPAENSDSELAYCLKRAAFREYVEMVWTWDEDDQWQKHEARFAAQHFQFVQVDDADVGVIATEQEDDGLKLNQLFIHPDHQGKGIGQICIQHIQKSSPRIRLQVVKVNPRALAFYLRHGFEITGETESHVQLQWAQPTPFHKPQAT